MKRWFAILAALCLTPGLWSQGGSQSNAVLRSTAGASGASIRICTFAASGTPCSPTQAIFSDRLLTVSKSNPFAADSLGNYSYFATPGVYKEQITVGGTTFTQYVTIAPDGTALYSLLPALTLTYTLGDSTHRWDKLWVKDVDISGTGGGDNVSVNGTAATNADFDDATPAAPANAINGKWQKDSSSPNNLSVYVPYAAPLTVTGGNLTCIAASDTVSGCAELAIASEINTGTDAVRAITPDALAGSNFGAKEVQLVVFDFATDTATGDGKSYFYVPPSLNGMNLVGVSAQVITVGTTSGLLNVDLARCATVATGNACSGTVADMLSTNLTIDINEDDSSTAATPAVINTANDDVTTGQIIRVDVDAVHGTLAKGLLVNLTFQLP
jgi:hypothetical protein